MRSTRQTKKLGKVEWEMHVENKHIGKHKDKDKDMDTDKQGNQKLNEESRWMVRMPGDLLI